MKSRFFSSVKTSVRIRNVFKLFSANVVAQVIGLLVYPILTRQYGAEAFGLMNLFLSIGGVLALCATAEYQYAILLPKSDRDADAIAQVVLLCIGGVTLLTACSLPFSGDIANLFDTPALRDWWYWMPLYVLLTALWTMLNYCLSRRKDFGTIAVSQTSQSVVNAGVKVGWGMVHPVAGGLLGGTLIGSAAGVGIGAWRLRRSGSLKEKWQGADTCRLVANEYKNFPLYSLPRALVNTLGNNIPALLLTPVFGLSAMGLFAMAITLAFRPINMICQSIYQVLYQDIAQRVANRETIAHTIRQYVRKALFVTFPLFVGLWFVLPSVTEWLLGDGWRMSGYYIRLMLPWLLMMVLVSPICFLSDVFQKQKIGAVFEVVLLLARLAGLGIGIYTHDFSNAVLGYSVGGAVVILAQLLWYINMVRRYECELFKVRE